MKMHRLFFHFVLLLLTIPGNKGFAQEINPIRPVPGLSASWIGQNLFEPVDLTNRSAAVGPDGFEDVQVELKGLSVDSEVESIDVETLGGGQQWSYGTNQQNHWSAEFVRSPATASSGRLVLSVPMIDSGLLTGKSLKISLTYTSGVKAESSVFVGKYSPEMAMPAALLPQIRETEARASWVGSVSASRAGQGAVRIEIDEVKNFQQITSITVSEPSGTNFIYHSGRDRHIENNSRDLYVEPLDHSRLRLDFIPNRDLKGHPLSICLLAEDKSMQIIDLVAGKMDLARVIPEHGLKKSKANPSIDLQLLIDQGGTIELSEGVYKLNTPLVIRKPVSITAADNSRAVLQFRSNSHQFWSSAIKISSGGVSLEGFEIECPATIPWNSEVVDGPALIASSSDKEQKQGGQSLYSGVRLSRLKISSSSVLPQISKNDPIQAVRLIRMSNVSQGIIENCILQGGGILLTEGPWLIRQNRYDGPPGGSISNEVILAHRPFDLIIESNRIEPLARFGDVKQFVQIRGRATSVRIGGNLVRNIGTRDLRNGKSDTVIPMIEAGSRRIKFEGEPLYISSAGDTVVFPGTLDLEPEVGDCIAILSGENAGRFHVVRQILGKGAIRVDPPINALNQAINPPAVSLSSGFKQMVIYKNTIEARTSEDNHIALKGNHFGTIVMNNVFEGGSACLQAVSPPTESPMKPGWSHAPMSSLIIHGNVTRDPEKPMKFSVIRGKEIKSSENRVYFSGQLNFNRLALPPSGIPVEVGDPNPGDPKSLQMLMSNNETGAGSAEIKVIGAVVNGSLIIDQKIPLTTSETIQTTDNRRVSR